VPEVTSINQHTHLQGTVVLRNLTSGAPWQAEFFELDAGRSSIRRLPENISNKGKAVGFGSKAIAFSRVKPYEVFLAAYFAENEWMLFDGRRARALKSVEIQWSRSKIHILDAGIATLQITDVVASVSIPYLRPWLRHWFEDGWALDDIDIGCVISHLASDAGAKARLLEALRKA
jgi:hypothetical protein